MVTPCKECSLLRPLPPMGVGRKHACSYRPSARGSNSKSGACWETFSRARQCHFNGHRKIADGNGHCPVTQLTSLSSRAGGKARLASPLEAALRRAGDLCAIGLDDRKAPSISSAWPHSIHQRSNRSREAVHFGRCALRNRGPSAANLLFSFQTCPTWLSLIVPVMLSLAQVLASSHPGAKGQCFRYLWRQGG